MRISSLLDSGVIAVAPPWSTFQEAVRGLVQRLSESGRLSEDLVHSAVEAVCERERVADTVIVEISVGIPHARVIGVREVLIALAVSPTALYALGGIPISIMALVLSPPEMAAEHLNALSAFSMLLQSEQVRCQLRTAANGEAALMILQGQEGGA